MLIYEIKSEDKCELLLEQMEKKCYIINNYLKIFYDVPIYYFGFKRIKYKFERIKKFVYIENNDEKTIQNSDNQNGNTLNKSIENNDNNNDNNNNNNININIKITEKKDEYKEMEFGNKDNCQLILQNLNYMIQYFMNN